MNWNTYLNQARSAEYGEKIAVPKDAVFGVPRGFEESALSFPNGATKVYREARETDTLQLREYEDRYTLQKDRYHPQEYPVRHAVHDATKYTALGVAALVALASGGA